MKNFLALAMLLLGFGVMNAQSMKMVVDSQGNVVGRYVKTNKSTHSITVQDIATVPKRGHKVVTYRAAKGQGVVFYDQTRTGSLNVRQRPTTNSPVVAQIPHPEGIPDCYQCLGKTNGWYKLEVDGVVGYVRGDLLEWDGMCTF